MDKFKDRERAFEAEQSHKEQSEFDKRNSRNKVFAEFILDHIGQQGNQELLKEIVLSDLEEPVLQGLRELFLLVTLDFLADQYGQE